MKLFWYHSFNAGIRDLKSVGGTYGLGPIAIQVAAFKRYCTDPGRHNYVKGIIGFQIIQVVQFSLDIIIITK